MPSEPELLGPKRMQELFRRHGIRPRKSLGQNFVIDPNTIRKVVAAAGVSPGEHVLEIGAGAGSLTLGLAGVAARVTALEIDPGLLPVLREVTADLSNVEVVEGDALTFDLASIPASRLVANLPYNVATPVVLRVLEQVPRISELVVMTQREVGERLAAAPGSKIYGAPSVAAGFFAAPEVIAPISRRAFWPVPNVDSVLVRLRRHEEARPVGFGAFRAIVRTAFAQRRKSLRNSLAPLAGGSTETIEARLSAAGVDPSARPERLTVAEFVTVTQSLEED